MLKIRPLVGQVDGGPVSFAPTGHHTLFDHVQDVEREKTFLREPRFKRRINIRLPGVLALIFFGTTIYLVTRKKEKKSGEEDANAYASKVAEMENQWQDGGGSGDRAAPAGWDPTTQSWDANAMAQWQSQQQWAAQQQWPQGQQQWGGAPQVGGYGWQQTSW